MEANGTWQETMLLVSSDHPFRAAVWQGSAPRAARITSQNGSTSTG
jgi:hypothetical protein